MIREQQPLQDLQHIKKMMEQSSRFISLSGLSGIAAGCCALAGAWFASRAINCSHKGECDLDTLMDRGGTALLQELIMIAALTFAGALVSAFFFTYLRSKKNGIPLWGTTALRLFWNTVLPLAGGGIFIIRLLQYGTFGLVAPACLVFYGLALINASKYTLGEIRYLGLAQLALGLISSWCPGYGIFFWATGFGILHIVYGLVMWYKYERV